MQRKLIKQGNQGYTVTLPITWIRTKNLKASDEIEINEVGEGLLLSVERKKEQRDISVDFSFETEFSIRARLNDLYRLGYDQIQIKYKNKEQSELIGRIVSSCLLGFEKTSETEHKLIIESITEPNEGKEHVLLRRMFLLIKESFNLTRESLETNKITCLDELSKIYSKIDLYDNFNKRNIYKKRMVDTRFNHYWNLYSNLLLIQHSIYYLVKSLSNKRFNISKSNLDILDHIDSIFDEVYNSFFNNKSNQVTESSIKLKEILYERIHKKIMKSSGAESIFLYYLGELTRLIYVTNVPISCIISINE